MSHLQGPCLSAGALSKTEGASVAVGAYRVSNVAFKHRSGKRIKEHRIQNMFKKNKTLQLSTSKKNVFKKDGGAFGKGSVGEVHFSLTSVTFSVKDLNQKPTPWQKTSSADFQRPRVPSCFGGASRHGFATMDLDQNISNQSCFSA